MANLLQNIGRGIHTAFGVASGRLPGEQWQRDLTRRQAEAELKETEARTKHYEEGGGRSWIDRAIQLAVQSNNPNLMNATFQTIADHNPEFQKILDKTGKGPLFKQHLPKQAEMLRLAMNRLVSGEDDNGMPIVRAEDQELYDNYRETYYRIVNETLGIEKKKAAPSSGTATSIPYGPEPEPWGVSEANEWITEPDIWQGAFSKPAPPVPPKKPVTSPNIEYGTPSKRIEAAKEFISSPSEIKKAYTPTWMKPPSPRGRPTGPPAIWRKGLILGEGQNFRQPAIPKDPAERAEYDKLMKNANWWKLSNTLQSEIWEARQAGKTWAEILSAPKLQEYLVK